MTVESPRAASKQRYQGIQALRALAAGLVVAYHIQAAGAASGGGVFPWAAEGEIGVDIFFVISGFIIFTTAERRGGLRPGAFLRARFFRIFPPYWAVLTGWIAILLAAHFAIGEPLDRLSLRSLVVSYLLLPYSDMVLIIAWTLAVELVFYAVFCFSFLAIGRTAFWIAMVVWVGLAQINAYVLPEPVGGLSILLHSANMEFLFGALIAANRHRFGGNLQWAALVVGAVGVALYSGEVLQDHWPPLGREYLAGIPAACLVIGASRSSLNLPALLSKAGDASYLLYLVHLPLFSVTGTVLMKGAGFDPYVSLPGALGLLVLAHVVALALHEYGERPYHAWYRQRQGPSRDGR